MTEKTTFLTWMLTRIAPLLATKMDFVTLGADGLFNSLDSNVTFIFASSDDCKKLKNIIAKNSFQNIHNWALTTLNPDSYLYINVNMLSYPSIRLTYLIHENEREFKYHSRCDINKSFTDVDENGVAQEIANFVNVCKNNCDLNNTHTPISEATIIKTPDPSLRDLLIKMAIENERIQKIVGQSNSTTQSINLFKKEILMYEKLVDLQHHLN